MSSIAVLKNEMLVAYHYEGALEEIPPASPAKQDGLYVGARSTVESFGGHVDWDSKSKTAQFTLNGKVLTVQLNGNSVEFVGTNNSDTDKIKVVFNSDGKFEFSAYGFLEYFDIGGMYGNFYDDAELMTPAAYSYAMINYYNFYLSDNQYNKQVYFDRMVSFAENDYKEITYYYSNKDYWNNLIKEMPQKPGEDMT